ncbi:MAG TPA: hypothetical protein P5318_19975, partial [Candidatus Hydrogenedentes bacterium]|nr:hypothetical protein [Candidatus Hydrogenedentota bacterium]
MKVEPEIEMPEHEPMRPRHLRASDEMRRRVKRELSRRRRIRAPTELLTIPEWASEEMKSKLN